MPSANMSSEILLGRTALFPFAMMYLFFVHPACGADPVQLKYQWSTGGKRIVSSKVSTVSSQSINGMKTDISMTQETTQSILFGEVKPDTVVPFTTKTEHLKTSFEGMNLTYQFDSKLPDRDKSSILGAALTPVYERLVGSELKGEIDQQGHVKSVTGYAALIGDLLKEQPVAAQFVGGGSDEVAKVGTQSMWLILPEKQVSIGDKWETPVETELSGLGKLKGKETITFLSTDMRNGHTIAKFAVTTDLSVELNMEANGAKITGNISTKNSIGSAEFDLTAGTVVRRASETELSGGITAEINGMSIPIQISQKTKTDLESLEKLPE